MTTLTRENGNFTTTHLGYRPIVESLGAIRSQGLSAEVPADRAATDARVERGRLFDGGAQRGYVKSNCHTPSLPSLWVPGMLCFRNKVIEKLLEDRKPHITLSTYQHIVKAIDRGAEGIDAYVLSNICRDLECLPNDIVEYV